MTSSLTNRLHLRCEALEAPLLIVVYTTYGILLQMSSLSTDLYGRGHVCSTRSGWAWIPRNSPQPERYVETYGVGCSTPSVLKRDTAVLFRSEYDHEVIAFGDDAYSQYLEGGHEDGQVLFRHFKMALHDGFTDDPQVSSVDDRVKLRLSTIMTATLKFVKTSALEVIGTAIGSQIDPSQIKWVITVPAIWTEPAKRIMRTCAQKAGLVGDVDSKMVVIALEPECAAEYVARSLRQTDPFLVGTKFMVLDCGGGTVDITIQCVDAIREGGGPDLHILSVPGGGDWGSSRVDRAIFDSS